MKQMLIELFEHKSIALLGFGKEGSATYTLFRKVFPTKELTIIDKNEAVRADAILKDDQYLNFITGIDALKAIDNFDVAIKSPGIPSNILPSTFNRVVITSQTDIFLQCCGKQVIGITGTKGKSTTASLVYHILKKAGKNALLVGNIGTPPFDIIDAITPDSVIVMELSSHQLEYISHSPHIAVLLNIFQEHLDHYHSYSDYQKAKLNIGKYQESGDFFIYNSDNKTLMDLIRLTPGLAHTNLPFSLEQGSAADIYFEDTWIGLRSEAKTSRLYNTANGQPLKGHHNLYNIMASAAACYLAGVTPDGIDKGIKSFNGLEHRIELLGEYDGILWYNDSIATIPEATIEAVRTLQVVDTLILGGFDRGIEYGILYPFLNSSGIQNIIFVGEAGTRMMNEFKKYGVNTIKMFPAIDYKHVIEIARKVTMRNKICLLSPAAASYDMFKNFEERGNVFKKNVRSIDPSHHE